MSLPHLPWSVIQHSIWFDYLAHLIIWIATLSLVFVKKPKNWMLSYRSRVFQNVDWALCSVPVNLQPMWSRGCSSVDVWNEPSILCLQAGTSVGVFHLCFVLFELNIKRPWPSERYWEDNFVQFKSLSGKAQALEYMIECPLLTLNNDDPLEDRPVMQHRLQMVSSQILF